MTSEVAAPTAIPHQSYLGIFLRFLRFGLLAWGGPVAQIAMIRQELVDEAGWISRERFNRVLAVYQALPGPEAHELCVYFGMIARGRIGGFLAGLGFMLPGLVLMLCLSWLYVAYGIASPLFASVFYGCQPAVAALIVRAVFRLGGHVLTSVRLWLVALGAAVAQVFDVNPLLTLAVAGLVYAVLMRWQQRRALSALLTLPFAVPVLANAAPSPLALFGYGLRSGLLTFGGAYTAIPFLQRDAVVVGAWMSNQQFLDGIALSNIIPAPLVIFSTFVGYIGGGLPGALAITAGMFLPAFAFTLIGHSSIEKLVENQAAQAFLDGVTAGVIGLVAVTAFGLARAAVTDLTTAVIFAVALAVLFVWKAKAAPAVIVIGAGVLGIVARLVFGFG